MNLSDPNSCPLATYIDYSFTETLSYPHAFDKAYIADYYTTSPDHSPAGYHNYDSDFDQILSSAEAPAPGTFTRNEPAVFNATLLGATTAPAILKPPHSPTFNPSPFGRREQFPSGFFFDTDSSTFESSASPQSQHSRTPSLCGDDVPQFQGRSSLELPPATLKCEPSNEGILLDKELVKKRPQRKPGRPRLDCSNLDDSSASGNIIAQVACRITR